MSNNPGWWDWKLCLEHGWVPLTVGLTWTSGSGTRNDTLYCTDGRQPFCNHPLRTPNQIVSDYKTKNYMYGSVTAQRECRPRESEKWQTFVTIRFPLRHWQVFTKNFEFHIFFSRLRVIQKQGEHKVTRTSHPPFRFGRFSNWNITPGTWAINTWSTFHQFHRLPGV